MSSVAAVAACIATNQSGVILDQITAVSLIKCVAVAAPPNAVFKSNKIQKLSSGTLRSAAGVAEALRWFDSKNAQYLLWLLSADVHVTAAGLARLVHVAADTCAAIVYSDYFDEQPDRTVKLHPLIDYQPGSVRDDFDFGKIVLLSRSAVDGIAKTLESDSASTEFGGWYDLRLRLSERGPIAHLSEPTYVALAPKEAAADTHFSYVDPRNRDYQIEMERIATAHLKRIGAWLPPPTERPVGDGAEFIFEASIVIPVRNRVKTVTDAVKSALSQQADFPFNVIVVDNHSTDGTTNALADLAASESGLVHLIPDRSDLGIGGCWNEAIFSQACGRFAVQLDSDDLYSSSDVLQKIVNEFRRGDYAVVIGSYTIVDFDLKQIPPGLIDHREWTDDNGHNNALRIAGLGAPRAFHVPTLRTIGFPNVSFGEDYAVALRMSRQYRIGRIYDSLYWCRRWEGNSDHALPLETSNKYLFYKDRLRSIEIAARQQRSRP